MTPYANTLALKVPHMSIVLCTLIQLPISVMVVATLTLDS